MPKAALLGAFLLTSSSVHATFAKGGDVSYLPQMEANGYIWKDKNGVQTRESLSSALTIRPAIAARASGSERKAQLRSMGMSSPARVLELAASERNWALREVLRNAALEGWAATAPQDAGDFVLQLPERERREAMAAVLSGAARDPDTTLRLAQRICERDPTLSQDYGLAAIHALGEARAFASAVKFASSSAADKGSDWLRAAFNQWSCREPSAALEAMQQLHDPEAHTTAFEGLALGWARANARELADYAAALPSGQERTFGVRQALTEWLARDPAAAADWMDRFDPGEEFDLGAANLAALPAVAQKHPDVALSWAASIVEPSLRSSTLASIGHEWSQSSPDQQVRLMEAARSLTPLDRQAIIDGIHAKTTE